MFRQTLIYEQAINTATNTIQRKVELITVTDTTKSTIELPTKITSTSKASNEISSNSNNNNMIIKCKHEISHTLNNLLDTYQGDDYLEDDHYHNKRPSGHHLFDDRTDTVLVRTTGVDKIHLDWLLIDVDVAPITVMMDQATVMIKEICYHSCDAIDGLLSGK